MRDPMLRLIRRRRKNGEKGQALAEYSLILAFVLIVCVFALGVIGLTLAGRLYEFAVAFP
jgi:Flp pilus assembly pilin Flp